MPSLSPSKNFAIVTLASGINDSATTMSLNSGHGAKLPTPGSLGFWLTIWNNTDYPNAPGDDPAVERVKVTALSGDTITTMVRGQDGTSASAHNTAGKTYKAVQSWGDAEIDQLQDKLDAMDAATTTLGTFLAGVLPSAIYGVDSGSANAMAITVTPTSYTAGNIFRVKVSNENTSNSVTLDVNGMGPVNIIKGGLFGGGGIQPGELKPGQIIEVVYDGVAGAFVMIGYTDFGVIRQGQYKHDPSPTGTADDVVLSLTPAVLTALASGFEVSFIASSTNTGAMTLDVGDGSGALGLKDDRGTDLSAGAIESGQMVLVIYNGSEFRAIGVR